MENMMDVLTSPAQVLVWEIGVRRTRCILNSRMLLRAVMSEYHHQFITQKSAQYNKIE